MSNETNESKPDLKELAKILSDAYYSILQHSTLTESQIISNLNQLAKYSNDLPTSWFTSPFLDALIALKTTYLQKQQLEALGSIISLFSSWLRRIQQQPAYDKDRLNLVTSSIQEILFMLDNRYLPIQKEAWIGWVSLIGQQHDKEILQAMTKLFELYTTHQDAERVSALSEALDAGLAHALAQTNCLNDFEVEYCQALLHAYIQFAAKRPDGPRAIMTAMEHVVDIRSQETPQTRAEADLNTLVDMAHDVVQDQENSLPVYFTCLAVLAGAVRMLQFNQGKKTKRVVELRKKAEKTFIEQLDLTIEKIYTKEHLNEYTNNQDTIAFFAGRCIIQIPDETVLTMKNKDLLLKLLTSSLLTSPYTFNSGDLLHRLKNTPEIKQELNQLVNSPMFKDIGRLSRAMAKLIQIDSNNDAVQHLLDRLVGASYNTFFDWDRYVMDTAQVSMSPEKSKNSKELESAAWTVLKSMAFSFTVLLKAIAVDVPFGKGLVAIPHAAQDIVSIYANLNFINEHLAEGAGRQAYQDTLTNAVAYLLHEDNRCQLNRLLTLAFKEYAPTQFVHQGQPSVELLSMVKQTRLTFFTDLCEQVIKSIDDEVLENHILPVIYPVLKWKRIENKNLYESAHTVVISAFIAKKDISSKLAAVYAKILIDNFPEPMNLDQFRFGFNTLIQALCDIDDALAWLTVKQLMEKINSLTSEKDIALRNQYITALIDMLKPMSLGPYFPYVASEIRQLILTQESPVIQKATMKIVYETVSGAGISDMRRVEAVKWFLELKHELNL